MAKITPNLSLVNPEKGLGEKYSLALWTANNDKIDARAGQVETDLGNAEGRLDLAETDLDALELNKVDKVTGKGLSTNDFTNTLKLKLETEIPEQLGEKANKVQEPFQSLSVINGATLPYNLDLLQVMKNDSGEIKLRGRVGVASSIVFTNLPLKYRPTKVIYFACPNASYGVAIGRILTTGDIMFLSGGSNVWVSLDNVQFAKE